jgi:integrase/recombinase XerC
MTKPLVEWIESFCQYQEKQRGKTKGGVQSYRWVLQQFMVFVRRQMGRVARVSDLTVSTIQAWMDEMAACDLALSTMRSRQSTVSSFCSWLVKRSMLARNPVSGMDRPPHRVQAPTQVPTPRLMDALIETAKRRQRPRDVALFLILRYTGMRRASVATLQVRHLDGDWGLRGVQVKGGKTRDIPLPASVMRHLHTYVQHVVQPQVGVLTPETPLFWSTWGKRGMGTTRRPMTGKNLWRLCKVYGRLMGYPMLKPHDLRHGVAMEVLEQCHDLEQVRALLGHARIDTTQIYTMIRPAQLKQAVAFYEEPAGRLVDTVSSNGESMFEEHSIVP